MKKTHEHIITLHICTKNNDHIMYGSLNMVCDRRTRIYIREREKTCFSKIKSHAKVTRYRESRVRAR